ncbi:potassium channel family protein [Wenjunlia tyrosinilytica]|uniref:potassium channel family protein n=1 Tax=Wenjunlia tyrosinilytica TaxID=1544741 RepID=UPI001E40A2A2|nr:potassium channel family protein [Wenjunlia tyrosinilytica]
MDIVGIDTERLEEAGEIRLARWERHTQGPLLALAVLFTAAYAVSILMPGHHRVHHVATWVEWVVWAAFGADYVGRLSLAEHRWRFVRGNPLALITVLLPIMQPLRLLRVVSAVLLVGQRVRLADQVRLTTYVVGSVFTLLVFGALGVLEAERGSPNGNIRTLDDAMWWAFTTMTTVGYGDHAPTTGRGRLIAVGLMLSGIALLGVVTANIAAWFIARFQEEEAEGRRGQQVLEELVTEVRALRGEVAALKAAQAPAPAAARHGGGNVTTDVPAPEV